MSAFPWPTSRKRETRSSTGEQDFLDWEDQGGSALTLMRNADGSVDVTTRQGAVRDRIGNLVSPPAVAHFRVHQDDGHEFLNEIVKWVVEHDDEAEAAGGGSMRAAAAIRLLLEIKAGKHSIPGILVQIDRILSD